MEVVLVPVDVPAAREASPRRQDIRTRVHVKRLLEIFRAPPSDYDGTNAKLAEYLGISKRQLIRVLDVMKDEDLIRTETVKKRHPEGGYYTSRMIQLVIKKESP